MKLSKQDKKNIVEKASDLFGFESSKADEIPGHEGGRNLVYKIADEAILRISTLEDRRKEDYAAEIEYIHFLSENGASVADTIPSKQGNRIEEIDDVIVSLFQVAKGDQLADHGYKYREGADISEYFYNSGKTIGRIHALSKTYEPNCPRFDFFDKYSGPYFEELIPDDFLCMGVITGREIKDKLNEILKKLRNLNRSSENYGMVHFDYSDGNYNIEYDSGKINVFDFDNCRTCWFLFDIANLWSHGLGWIAWNPDPEARRRYMDEYMKTVIEGYRSECTIEDRELENLELFVNVVLMENIVDDFEVLKANHREFFFDEEKSYNVKCLVDDLPWFGFYSDIFNVESPFEVEI